MGRGSNIWQATDAEKASCNMVLSLILRSHLETEVGMM